MNAAELDIVRSTLVSGTSGTVPKMKGIISGITTNATAQTSGTTLNLSILLGLMQDVWDNGNGKMVTDLFMGGTMKRRVSTFTTSNTKNVNATEQRVVEVVNILDTDFGQIRLNLHRFVQISSDATARILGVNMDSWRLAYLRKPFIQELSRTGDATKKQVIGDLTLENECEPSNFYVSGFLKSA